MLPLPFLKPHAPFPPLAEALSTQRNPVLPDHLNGLLCASHDLSPARLLAAYRQSIFPWYSEGQPVLWWSPDPRMVLMVSEFCLPRSLKKTIYQKLYPRITNQMVVTPPPNWQIRFDTDFAQVMAGCAQRLPLLESHMATDSLQFPAVSTNDSGSYSKSNSSNLDTTESTWITSEMCSAYQQLFDAGYAHSIEVWQQDLLIAGLYVTAIGRAVFGESMFTRVPNASKCALAALVAFCRKQEITFIDCQQETAHLARFGARPFPRTEFANRVHQAIELPPPTWQFKDSYWQALGLH